MKKDEAKRLVIQLWRNWPGDKVGAMAPLVFYNWVEINRPDVLDFRSPASKYTLVSGWIRTSR